MNTIERQETLAADHCLQFCAVHSQAINKPDDVSAGTVAILMRALEMATPDLTPELRASLFERDDD
jgi:hypothetical protein